MLRGLWKLTWLEIKIFVREPLGAFGTIGIPVLVFVVLGRHGRAGRLAPSVAGRQRLSSSVGLPVFASILIAISAVLSLVTIISIYREGGILKRLRATPLRPHTILTAHVLVKLSAHRGHARADGAGRQALLPGRHRRPAGSVHDRAAHQHAEHPVDRLPHRQRRAHRALRAADRRGHPLSDDRPLGALRAGRVAAARRCRLVARVLPLTYAVSLLQGIWKGDAWSAHLGDVAALAVVFVVCTALSAKVFRWE